MTRSEPAVNPNDRLELKAAAEALGVSRTTILKWTHAGYLTAHKSTVNGRFRWTGRDLIKCWRIMM